MFGLNVKAFYIRERLDQQLIIALATKWISITFNNYNNIPSLKDIHLTIIKVISHLVAHSKEELLKS